MASRNWKCHAMAASLLHAADVGWIPSPGRAPTLDGAFLHGESWPGIRLKKVDLHKTDLAGANLSEAQLSNVPRLFVQMPGAVLHGAQLRKFIAPYGNFADADLSFVRAPCANFFWANLRNARLEGALLRKAEFGRADLRGADCRRADMSSVSFLKADLMDTDFSGRTGRSPISRSWTCEPFALRERALHRPRSVTAIWRTCRCQARTSQVPICRVPI